MGTPKPKLKLTGRMVTINIPKVPDADSAPIAIDLYDDEARVVMDALTVHRNRLQARIIDKQQDAGDKRDCMIAARTIERLRYAIKEAM